MFGSNPAQLAIDSGLYKAARRSAEDRGKFGSVAPPKAPAFINLPRHQGRLMKNAGPDTTSYLNAGPDSIAEENHHGNILSPHVAFEDTVAVLVAPNKMGAGRNGSGTVSTRWHDEPEGTDSAIRCAEGNGGWFVQESDKQWQWRFAPPPEAAGRTFKEGEWEGREPELPDAPPISESEVYWSTVPPIEGWQTKDTALFLTQLEFTPYRLRFVTSGVDGPRLLAMSMADLHGLGVRNPFHAKRLYSYIRYVESLQRERRLRGNDDDLLKPCNQRRDSKMGRSPDIQQSRFGHFVAASQREHSAATASPRGARGGDTGGATSTDCDHHVDVIDQRDPKGAYKGIFSATRQYPPIPSIFL